MWKICVDSQQETYEGYNEMGKWRWIVSYSNTVTRLKLSLLYGTDMWHQQNTVVQLNQATSLTYDCLELQWGETSGHINVLAHFLFTVWWGRTQRSYPICAVLEFTVSRENFMLLPLWNLYANCGKSSWCSIVGRVSMPISDYMPTSQHSPDQLQQEVTITIQ